MKARETTDVGQQLALNLNFLGWVGGHRPIITRRATTHQRERNGVGSSLGCASGDSVRRARAIECECECDTCGYNLRLCIGFIGAGREADDDEDDDVGDEDDDRNLWFLNFDS